MAPEHKDSSPWIWVTLVFGLLGVVTTTPMLGTVTSTTEKAAKQADKTVDHSDDIYPTPAGAISKKLGPWEDPFEPIEKKLNYEAFEQGQSPLASGVQLQLNENGAGSSARFLVMVKIVDGKNNEFGRETRRRHRHALELAMASAGYSMPFPDRMTYVNATYQFFHTQNEFSSIPIDVPIKLYKKRIGPSDSPSEKSQLVLIAWVRNEHLGERPLAAISQIVQSILPADPELYKRSAFAILGPSSSNQLTKMVNEHTLSAAKRNVVAANAPANAPATDAPATDAPATSVQSTMPEFFSLWKYGAVLVNSSCTASNGGMGLKECQRHIVLGENQKLTIAHTIGEDSLLIERLVDELDLRGRNTRIVLFVEEQSQKYITELKDTFTKSANDNLRAEDVLVVPYLRGISETQASDRSVADYLARTFSELSLNHAEAVSAVGVFGTQTTDKIAIFKAARDAFPTAAFFTTELDARYSDGQNYSACRNILVASHFGLTCKTELFGGETRTMPTFRDGYQTSSYLATLIALDRFETTPSLSEPSVFLKGQREQQQDLYNLWSRPVGQTCTTGHGLQPLVFEISRLGNFQFPVHDHQSRVVVNAMERQRLFTQAIFFPRLFIALLLVLGICLVIQLYSSELERTLSSVGATFLEVGHFFSHLSKRSWHVVRRLTSARTYPTNASTLLEVPEQHASPRKSTKDMAGFVIWFVIALSTSLMLGFIAWVSDISSDGEPVTWADSISIWPSVLLFHSVSCISSYLILRFSWSNREVTQKGLVLALLLAGLIVSIMGVSIRDAPPARGEVTRSAASISLRTAAACLFILASLSSLSIMKARKEISTELKSELKVDAVGTEQLEPGNERATLSGQAEALLIASSRLHIQLLKAMSIGKDSSVTLIAPAALTIVLAIARLPLLDSWGLPRVWYVALMTPMLLSVVAAWLMRTEARSLKSEAVEKLETYQSMLLEKYAIQFESNNASGVERERFNDCIDKVGFNITLINRLNRGPFSSVYNDPLLGGLLLIITAALTGPMREQTISFLSFLHIT